MLGKKFCWSHKIAVVFGLSGLASVSAFAQQTEPATKKYGNWVAVCDEGAKRAPEKPCYARMTVRDTKRNVTLITWTIGFNKDGKPLMEILSPVGVVLEPGVDVQIEPGDSVKLPYVTCDAKGCMSRIALDKGLLRDLKAAEKATISISATNGQRINFGIPMEGSAMAITSLGLWAVDL